MMQRKSLDLSFLAGISQPLHVTGILCLAPTGIMLILSSLPCSSQKHILSSLQTLSPKYEKKIGHFFPFCQGHTIHI